MCWKSAVTPQMQPDPPATYTQLCSCSNSFTRIEKSVVATLLCCQQAPPLNKSALKYHKITFEAFMNLKH